MIDTLWAFRQIEICQYFVKRLSKISYNIMLIVGTGNCIQIITDFEKPPLVVTNFENVA